MSRFEDARQMILGLDALHLRMTTMIQNARPPRFDCRWLDERTLEVTYKSHRPLLEIYMGLARGVGKYFGEPLKVDAVGGSRVRIEFA